MGPLAPKMSGAKGFEGATYLADDTTGQYGALVLWESKGDAEAFFEIAFPKLQSALEGIVKAPPTTTLFEVFEPKA
jgi:heme-degrading monooxygenase HmoA